MIDPIVFRKHVGSVFTVRDDKGPLDLRLADVTDDGIANGIHQFSLLFDGPGDRILDGRIHSLSHPVLGTNDIFVVPVHGSSPGRTIYQACFSVPAAPSVRDGAK